jgi:hypothetical protein
MFTSATIVVAEFVQTKSLINISLLAIRAVLIHLPTTASSYNNQKQNKDGDYNFVTKEPTLIANLLGVSVAN